MSFVVQGWLGKFSVWFVSGYAHVFVLLAVVILPYPQDAHETITTQTRYPVLAPNISRSERAKTPAGYTNKTRTGSRDSSAFLSDPHFVNYMLLECSIRPQLNFDPDSWPKQVRNPTTSLSKNTLIDHRLKTG